MAREAEKVAQGDYKLFFQAMIRSKVRLLSLTLLTTALMGCEKLLPKKVAPLTTSKDFWIDRCDITYQGKPFPITGTIEEMIQLLGPADRADTVSLDHNYFWDDLGLKVHLVWQSKILISTIAIHFDREVSLGEEALRSLDRPEDRIELARLKDLFPHRFFKGEVVLEGAVIRPIIDFKQVDETRIAYMKTQSGPDARLKSASWRADPGFRPITSSYSFSTYYLQRFCADGRHLGFVFRTSQQPPYRLQSLTIGSDNVPDSISSSP